MANRWLLVSKPLRRPFDDGTTRLCETLVGAYPRDRGLAYLGDPKTPLRALDVDEVIERAPMGHAPSLAQKVGVLKEMLRPGRRRQPIHVFFTPNPVTSRVLATVRTMSPSRPIVQTVTSAHRVERFAPLLRRLDRVIVLSDDSRARLVAAGLAEEQVVRIHPAVPSVTPETGPVAPRMLFAGDLDAEVAQRLIGVGQALERPELAGWTLVIACRPKGEGDAEARSSIRRALADELASGRVELHGRVDDFDGLMRGCGLQLFVASHARNKVDLPVTVLEGLARGLGVVMIDAPPISEILDRATDHGLEVGQRASPEQLVDVVAAACSDPSRLDAWRVAAPRLAAAAFDPAEMAAAYAEIHATLAP